MDNVNRIVERSRPEGFTGYSGPVDYIVNYGLVLYNNRILNLSNLVIPIWGQSFFNLPADKNRYALVNAYYDADRGLFRFDTVLKSDKFIQSATSEAIPNLIPIAQFVLQQSLSGFVVVSYNQYSKMSTFSVTDTFISGDIGFQAGMGYTGPVGDTGTLGITGLDGYVGVTGYQGVTGAGIQGYQGIEGATGYYQDMDLLYYAKFKSDDNTLQDYSPYQRDCGWGASGAGVTGIIFVPGSTTVTGIQFISTDLTSYVLGDGIVDNSHSVVYRGGWSSYSRERYLDFWGYTGMIQAWVRVDVAPLVNFTWTADPLLPLKVLFEDQSLFSPISWEWSFGSVATATSQNPTIIFSSSGSYMVKLKATNVIGYSERTKMVTV